MLPYHKIGIVAAMSDEIAPVFDKLGKEQGKVEARGFVARKYIVGEREIYVSESGIGEVASAVATQMLIALCGVDLIINFGIAGSLNPIYDIGDTVLCRGVVHYDRDLSPIDNVKPTEYAEYGDTIPVGAEVYDLVHSMIPTLPIGLVSSSEKFVADTSIKNTLVDKYHVDLCEMEAAGVALTCARAGVQCLILKAISDKADNSANMSYYDMKSIAIAKVNDLLATILD